MSNSLKSLALGAVAAALIPGVAHADITVYSAGPGNLIDALAKGFTKQTGIKAKVFQGTTGKVMARIDAEASNPVVDVVISASWDTANDFTKRGWLIPYTSPNAAKVPASLKSDTAVAEGISALAIVWNADSKTPKPAEWADLAKPDYKDLVNIPDPAQSGASFELVAALQAQYGWDLFKSLKANGAAVAGANAEALNPVLQGAKAAVFGAVDYIAMGEKAKGETIQVIFPASGTNIAPRPLMLMKWSKQPEEAKKFEDYVLSDAGQKAVADVYLMPARTDIAANRPLITDLKVLSLDTKTAYAKRKDTLKQFTDLFGK